ncbi:MAG: lamin tail domain-containing protein, partial [Verrucomicrobia bacterium]|nr:lamin tail domain-containing protein [Verrucomicrobiota bacterium]
VGRWPDGAADWYLMSTNTPGARNAGILINDIVMNEIMYKPISGDNDDQYLELYNKGTSSVNIGGWQMSANGSSFYISSNTVMAAGAYLILAHNVTNLFAHYTNLTTGNTLGDFGFTLPHSGGRITLGKPDVVVTTNVFGAVSTNTIYVVVDEVTYHTGGRWPHWAHGSGSSMELINPNLNHRLAQNWADSDETRKSAWTSLEYTGTLDLGYGYSANYILDDFVQVGLLGEGECLIDNIEVRSGGTNGANVVYNPDFEAGTNYWWFQGDHIRSSLETSAGLGGYNSSQSVHIRSSDLTWTGANSVQGSLSANSLSNGAIATLRLKARWLYGWPEILMRLRGNYLEVTGPLLVPANLGSPGQRNSRYVTNAGPAIYEVKHSPSIPPAKQPVVVTARFHHPNGSTPVLKYRIDTGVNLTPSYTVVPMLDDGTGDDAVVGDGLYSATIPGQNAGTIVPFIVQAQSPQGVVNIFPADDKSNTMLNGQRLARECIVVFGDAIPAGSFGHYHLWLSQNWISRWTGIPPLANENNDATWVDGGGRVIYNTGFRYAGSPYHQGYNSPTGNPCNYHGNMPDDDMFLGTKSFNKLHVPGNSPGDDSTVQTEQISYWMARQIGIPWLYRRYIVMYVNGGRRNMSNGGPPGIMEDTQVPGGDVISEHWPNDNNGFLYKNNGWFEFDYNGSPFVNNAWCTLNRYTTTINGVPNQHKLARYRWNYVSKSTPDWVNNYTNVTTLVDAANIPTTASYYYPTMEALADTDTFLRTFAVEHASGNWDSVGNNNEWNMYYYKPLNGKWTPLIWDWNITLGNSGSWGPDGSRLFNVNVQAIQPTGSAPQGDTPMSNFETYPPYYRAYLRALKDVANLGMNSATVNPVMDARYAALQANGINAVDPGAARGSVASLKSWIATMRISILTALTNNNVANTVFAVSSSTNVVGTNSLITISGTAPLEVKTITVNGQEYLLPWSGSSVGNNIGNWKLNLVASQTGTNLFVIQGLDVNGNPISNATAAVNMNMQAPVDPPQGNLVINEIMYNPVVSNATYVELFNRSYTTTFDLTGYRLRGLSYDFAGGATIAPRTFLLLAKDLTAFAAAYGPLIKPFDVYPGTLDPAGEPLRLVKLGATPDLDVIVSQVSFETVAPWPTAPATNSGISLQLIDPSQDTSRVNNWATGGGWSFFSVTGLPGPAGTNLQIYLDAPGDMYLDDVMLVPGTVAGVGTNLIKNGDFETPLYNSWYAWAITPTNKPYATNSSISTAYAHSGNILLIH